LGGHNAWVEGIGEKITPISVAPARFLVVKPDAGLDTAKIFGDPGLKRDSEPAIISGFAANAFINPLGFGRNDLQAVAQKLCPGVSQAIDWLESQGLKGRMTGSGSAVFALVQQGGGSLRWSGLDSVPAGFEAKVCSSVAVHPLWGWAASDGLSVGSD
jgi:4-diphosphocytidyl-2-C-methyl-D-erythritol kinase